MKKAGILVAAILCFCSFHSFGQQMLKDTDFRKASETDELSLLQNDDSTHLHRIGSVDLLLQSTQSFVDINSQQLNFICSAGYYSMAIGFQPAAELHRYQFPSLDLNWKPAINIKICP